MRGTHGLAQEGCKNGRFLQKMAHFISEMVAILVSTLQIRNTKISPKS